MGTKDLTHEALIKALSENTPLSPEQRSMLISAIADDKHWQRVLDAETQRLSSTITDLRALLDEQTLLLTDVNEICGRDGFDVELEDGESEIIDRIRAHLKRVNPANGAPPSSNRTKDKIQFFEQAVVGGAGMGIPPGAGTPPAGMGAVLLYVPLSVMDGKSPIEMQAEMGLPWSGPNGEPFWFPQNQPAA